MRITEQQAGAIMRLEMAGYAAGTTITLSTLFPANTRLDRTHRRNLRKLAWRGLLDWEGTEPDVCVVRAELFRALALHDQLVLPRAARRQQQHLQAAIDFYEEYIRDRQH